MKKVLFILKNAPNYRDIFLQELGKHVDLTVMAYPGEAIGLKEPLSRTNYRYIPIKDLSFLGIHFNTIQYRYASKGFDVIILRPAFKEPFLLLNLLRKDIKKILFGHIFSNRLIDTDVDNRNSIFIKGVRKWMFKKTDAFLVHSNFVSKALKGLTNRPIYSFNNSYFFKQDINELPFEWKDGELNILWVGRYRRNKFKLRNVVELIRLAERNKNVNVRLVGTDMKKASNEFTIPENVTLYDEVFDDSELRDHFKWSHVVMNPGNLGLLAVNSARFGRPIVVDIKTPHPPEIQLALDSDQIFVDFDDREKVDKLIEELINDGGHTLELLGNKISQIMRNKYTVEYMIDRFLEAIYN